MKWKKEILQGAIYALAVSPFYLTGHALYDLVTDGYTPRLASIAMASTLLGAFLTVWSTRAEPWKWIKRHWYTPFAATVVVLQTIAMFHEGFTAQRLNTILWIINAIIFWEVIQVWRDTAKIWEELYWESKGNKPS